MAEGKAATTTERIRVMLTSHDESRIKAYFLDRSASVAVAKGLWARKWKCSVDSFVLLSNNVVLDDDTSFSAFPFSGSGIIELVVDEKVSCRVRLDGRQETANIPIALCMCPEDIYEVARSVFHLGEDVVIRFRRGSTILAEGISFRESGIDKACDLQLEFTWRVIERRFAQPDAEVFLFRTDLLACLASSQCRLHCGTLTAESASEADALMQNCGPSPLILEVASEVASLLDGQVRPQQVWSDGDLQAKRPLMLRDHLLPCREVTALPPSCLLHEPLRVTVLLPRNRRRIVRVPRDGCVLNLLTAVGLKTRMQAELGGRALKEDDSLRGLQNGVQVRLTSVQENIHVRFGGRDLRWKLPEHREQVTFGEIVAGVTKGLPDQRRLLMAGVLACRGCGRKLSRERQGVQRVPSDCCEERSMRLCFGGKPREISLRTDRLITSDYETQTDPTGTTEAVLKIETGTQTEAAQTEPEDKRCKKIRNRGDSTDINLSVRLPDGHVIRRCFARSYTLEDLSEEMRRSGDLFRVDEILLGGRSLIGGPGGKQRSLAMSGVCDGDELVLVTALPREVTVFSYSMNESFSVTVHRGENSWERIQAKLPRLHGKSLKAVSQVRLFYRSGNECRSAILSSLAEGYSYLDEEDSRTADVGSGAHFVFEFFLPGEGFRAAPLGNPVVFIAEDVLRLQAGRIVDLQPDALFDPQFVALLRGFSCSRSNGAIKHLLLRCSGGVYFDSATGRRFEDDIDCLEFAGSEGLTLKRICLLLRDIDFVPSWSLPEDLTILVLRRSGVELQIQNNRITRKGDDSLLVWHSSCWTCPFKIDKFQRDFSISARRKRNY